MNTCTQYEVTQDQDKEERIINEALKPFGGKLPNNPREFWKIIEKISSEMADEYKIEEEQ